VSLKVGQLAKSALHHGQDLLNQKKIIKDESKDSCSEGDSNPRPPVQATVTTVRSFRRDCIKSCNKSRLSEPDNNNYMV
jgi:hypothetical protein